MQAYVDTRQNVVECDGRQWRFDLDCRAGAVSVTLGQRKLRMRRVSWREKRTLAGFVHLGEAFLKEQFVLIALGGNEALPDDGCEREALWALARWLNGPDGEFGLPLDQRLLASVTLDLCRAMQLAPAAFEEMEACEVELLWQAAQSGQPQATGEAAGARIMVVPDPESYSTEAPESPGSLSLSDVTSAAAGGAQRKIAVQRKETNPAGSRSAQGETQCADASRLPKVAPKLPAHDGTVTSETANRFRVVWEPVRTNRAAEKVRPLHSDWRTGVRAPGESQRGNPAAAPVVAGGSEMSHPAEITSPAQRIELRPGELPVASSLSMGAPAKPARQWHWRGEEAPYNDEVTPDIWLDEFADRLHDAARALGVDVEAP